MRARSLHPRADRIRRALAVWVVAASPAPPNPTPPPRPRPLLGRPDGRHTPDERRCASAARRLAPAGSSGAPACQSVLWWSARLTLGWVGLGWVGWAKSLRQPSASAGLERSTRAWRDLPARRSAVVGKDQHLRRAPAGAPALPRPPLCDGRRQAPEPAPLARAGGHCGSGAFSKEPPCGQRRLRAG